MAGMDERKKQGWPFWFAVGLILLPMLYVASVGPVCGYSNRTGNGGNLVGTIYSPVYWALHSHKLPR